MRERRRRWDVLVCEMRGACGFFYNHPAMAHVPHMWDIFLHILLNSSEWSSWTTRSECLCKLRSNALCEDQTHLHH